MQASRHRAHEHLFAAGMAWLLVLFTISVVAATRPVVDQLNVQLRALRDATLSRDQGALLLPGGATREAVAELRFTLPPPDPERSRWVVWVGHEPVDVLWLQRPGWSSARRGFFHQAADEGVSGGFVLPLPADWSGPIAIELHARGGFHAALRPRVMSETTASRIGHRAIALNSAAYAGLFMLALLALALYSAARERSFLMLFACASATLLMMAADNGHLYGLPVLGAFAAWQGAGLWALGLLFCAAALHSLRRYAGLRDGMALSARLFDGCCIGLVALAALCLLDLQPLLPWLQAFATIGWTVTGAAAVVVLADALRRHVPMAWSMLVLVLVSGGAVLVRAALAQGWLQDMLWTRYGYQFILVVAVAVLTISQITRISEYRDQRDRDRLARVDSERRMGREAARAELTLALQTRLRSQAAADVEWTAFHLLLEHLVPQIPVEVAAVVASGYHGHDLLLVEPVDRQPGLQADINGRSLQLKRQAAAATPLQQPHASNPHAVMEAVVPLAIRAPGWGALLLRRAGNDGFSTEEMALAGEFARLAVLHADEAVASHQLRRSAELDALTGAFNRRSVDQWLARSFVEADRRQQTLSLLFIDIDHFKSINDRLGHAGGDECLRQVAAALRAALDDDDLLGRYGGEEFVVLLPGKAGAEAREVGERLRAAVERCLLEYDGRVERLTVSVGVATRLEQESTPAAAIERADKALYAAKRGGRNCVHVAPAVFS